MTITLGLALKEKGRNVQMGQGRLPLGNLSIKFPFLQFPSSCHFCNIQIRSSGRIRWIQGQAKDHNTLFHQVKWLKIPVKYANNHSWCFMKARNPSSSKAWPWTVPGPFTPMDSPLSLSSSSMRSKAHNFLMLSLVLLILSSKSLTSLFQEWHLYATVHTEIMVLGRVACRMCSSSVLYYFIAFFKNRRTRGPIILFLWQSIISHQGGFQLEMWFWWNYK